EGHPGGGQGQGDQGADGDLIGYGRDATHADPLLEYLLGFRERMGQPRRLLTDAERTAFFFVTLPEALPIAVISRFIGWFHEFGIPVGGVIVNMVLDRQALGDDARVRPEPRRDAGGAPSYHPRQVRRRRPRRRSAIRPGGARNGHAGPGRRGAVRLSRRPCRVASSARRRRNSG